MPTARQISTSFLSVCCVTIAHDGLQKLLGNRYSSDDDVIEAHGKV